MSPYEMASWEHWNPADATAGRSASDFDSVIDDLRVANERLIIASLREQELAEQSQFQSARLNALLNSINEGVVVANPLGEIVLANPLARTTLGFSDRRPLTLQQDWARIEMRSLDQTMLAMSENPLVRALRGERFSEYEILALVPIVGERRLSFTSGVVKDEIGDVVQAILLFRDVTELRKLEQQREESLSLISHDLRTPLTVIMGRAEMLSALTGCDDNGSLSNEIDSILRSARRMREILDEFLETSRLESGNANLRKEPVDLFSVVVGVISDVLPPSDRARVHVDTAPGLPEVTADAIRLGRVVANLITNALKFSERTSPVKVSISRGEADVVVSVADRGVGIASDEVHRIFERYYQTTAGLKRRGQGLGLYLSRLIVEASGGRMWVTSVPGQGSTFHFSLPIH